MSQLPISLSSDLQRLRTDGYDIEIRHSHLLVKGVPYVNSKKEIAYGILASTLHLAGDITLPPDTHVAYLSGEYPCHSDGSPMHEISHQSPNTELGKDLVLNHSFSHKPSGGYANYYDKMTTYVAILDKAVAAIDPDGCLHIPARTFKVVEATETESVFNYLFTASTSTEIIVATKKLELHKIAIVGLGGTGSYVLDLVAKTPVGEIHLFDDDRFTQNNAFRSPGAPSIEELRQVRKKVAYFKEIYSKMHRHIFAHEENIESGNVEMLRDMDFVFICMDEGLQKKLIVDNLEGYGKPFVHVGMAILVDPDSRLAGHVKVTASTPAYRNARSHISFARDSGDNIYSRNIQIADLNAFNAAVAVIKWKKLVGFYRDLDHEHHSTYELDGNRLINEDAP